MKTSRFAVVSILCALSGAALSANDLSRYREFQLGTDLAAVAKKAHSEPPAAKVIQQRPALLQELTWRPQTFGSPTEPVRSMLFSFYNGELYQIGIDYDSNRTEGMSTSDMVEAIAANYGPAAAPPVPVKTPEQYGETDETLASWENNDDSVRLVRRAYSHEFALIMVEKKLVTLAESSIVTAKRLDVQEAPEREVARARAEADAARVKSEQARSKNIPNFRP